MLQVRDLACGYGGQAIISGIDFDAPEGRVLVILGPNGVGKTTLFKTILGLIPMVEGRVLMDGRPVDMSPSGPDMRRLAYVPQAHVPAFAFTVLEMVLMGRTCRMKAFATPSDDDRGKAEETLRKLGLLYLKDSLYTEISGGERQMVLIARALTQDPDILIMDEPASSLDLGNQAKLLRVVRDMSREKGLSVVMTTHNPDHALAIADEVLLFKKNGFTHGPACEVLTGDLLTEAYGTSIKIMHDRSGGDLRGCVLEL